MKKWQSALVLFVSVFVLYAVYMWFVKGSRDVSALMVESLLFSAALTVVSTVLDVFRGKVSR